MFEPREPDVAAILEALRAEVRAQRLAQGIEESGTPLSAIERELRHAAEQLEVTRVVSAHWPLQGRGLYERGMVLVHKLVRRYLRWYINPIVEQQNAFNDAAARTLRLLAEAHAELRDQAAELRRQRDEAAPPDDGPPAADAPAGRAAAELPERLRELRAHQAVSAHLPLDGAAPAALAKRGVRQYLRWLVNPIVEQQNGCNDALAETAVQLAAAQGEMRARIAALRPRAPGSGQ